MSVAVEGKENNNISIILFSGELDKALASFVVATSAASMGMNVTIFFTFWGLNVVKKNPPFMKGSGIMEKMLSIMNRGGHNRLPLSKLNMAGMGPFMLKKMMQKKKVPSINMFIELARQLNIKFIACEMSMSVMGLTKEDLIEDVQDVVGAVSYLDYAQDAKVNLFI